MTVPSFPKCCFRILWVHKKEVLLRPPPLSSPPNQYTRKWIWVTYTGSRHAERHAASIKANIGRLTDSHHPRLHSGGDFPEANFLELGAKPVIIISIAAATVAAAAVIV